MTRLTKNSKNIRLIGMLTVVWLSLLAVTAQAGVDITYIHNDALGSAVAGTDEQGEVKWRSQYAPYGEERLGERSAFGIRSGYTGHRDDPETGLTYMGARYYSPVIGRFMGVDPAGVDATDIYSFNRYVYANNNPYTFVDPDGENAAIAACAAGPVTCGLGVLVTIYTGYRAVVDTINALQNENADDGAGDGEGSKNGPKPNNGNARPHGNNTHNDAIDDTIRDLKEDPSVSNVRKNQRQVDVNGNQVGTNRPDVQFDKDGCHNCVEFDHVPKNSQRHGDVIRNNDPNTNVDLKLL